MLVVIGALWLAGLLVLLFVKRRKSARAPASAPPPSLAERLRPLVAAASTGSLDDDGRARLDRLVIGHWRGRLPELDGLPPSEALARLRRHPEASPLLLALEKWLHAPAHQEPSDLRELLRPYTTP